MPLFLFAESIYSGSGLNFEKKNFVNLTRKRKNFAVKMRCDMYKKRTYITIFPLFAEIVKKLLKTQYILFCEIA